MQIKIANRKKKQRCCCFEAIERKLQGKASTWATSFTINTHSLLASKIHTILFYSISHALHLLYTRECTHWCAHQTQTHIALQTLVYSISSPWLSCQWVCFRYKYYVKRRCWCSDAVMLMRCSNTDAELKYCSWEMKCFTSAWVEYLVVKML